MRRPGSDRRRSSPDAWASDHQRAQFRAAQRLDGPLGARESTWLDDHLRHCAECNEVARAYQDDRRALRSLPAPEPPRDLWARTAAALDREAARPTRRGGFRIGWSAPFGALAGVLVVAVVVGASLVNQRNGIVPVQSLPGQSATTASVSSAPESTRLNVTADDVGFVHRGADNTIQIFKMPVTQVCAADAAPDCPPATDLAKAVIKLPRKPGSIIGSPLQTQLVVVDDSAATSGGTVSVVPVTSTESASPSASAAMPSANPSIAPSASPSAAPASPTPTATPRGSQSPSPPPSVQQSPSPSPATSVEPSATPPGSSIDIASNVIVVGQSAAYSGDGQWFAFSARPADDSQGPDIYVWTAGDTTARAVTNDHRSTFSAWIGNEILGSRAVTTAASATPEASSPPSASPSPGVDGAAVPSTSFLVDPTTGLERAIDGDGIFRPVIDPRDDLVVYWSGTIRSTDGGLDWQPAEGRLVLARWDPGRVEASTSATSPGPSGSAELSTASPTADAPSPVVSPTPISGELATLASGPIADWDARWDETGLRLAVWIADQNDRGIGRLSLFNVDAQAGIATTDAQMQNQLAVPGFSIGNGRLAWITHPTGGTSQVEVLAWSGRDAGKIQSQPGTDLTLIR
jgi:hypothetical protein